jgi:hypothetical protein
VVADKEQRALHAHKPLQVVLAQQHGRHQVLQAGCGDVRRT